MRQFTKSVIVITAFAAVTRIIGFVFRIFLSRILGAEMLGVYQMATSIFMILLTVIGSGLPLVISREVAKIDPRDRRILHLTLTGLAVGIGVSLLLCVLILCGHNYLGWLFTDQRCLGILIALLPALVASSIYCVLRAVWWGQKKFFLLGLTELIEQIARVILFVILMSFTLYFASLAHLAAWAFTGACIISATVVVIIFIKGSHFNRDCPPTPSYLRPLLKAATPITGVRLFSSMTAPLIAVLLPLRLVAAGWSNTAAIAHLGIVTGMTLPLLTIPSTVISSLATALVPELATMVNAQRWEAVRHQINVVLKFTIFINFCFIPIYLAIGTPIGEFLYHDPYSGLYLARSAWVMLPLSLGQITNTTLNALNQENITIRNYAIGSLVLLIIIWFFPAIIGADAVLLGMGLSLTVATVLNLLAIRKTAHYHQMFSLVTTMLLYLIITVPVTALGYFTYQLGATLPLLWQISLAAGLAELAFWGLSWVHDLIIIPKKRQ